MSINVTELQDYVSAKYEYILDTIMTTPKSFNMLYVYQGVKSAEKVPDVLDEGIVIKSGDYTGYGNHEGGIKLIEKLITVEEIWAKENYKKQALQAKLTQLGMAEGSNPDDTILNDIIMKLKGNAFMHYLEKQLWQGDTAAGSFNHFDGFVKLSKNETGIIKTGTVAAAYDAATAIAGVNRMIEKFKGTFPEMFAESTPQTIFMSPADYDVYRTAIYDLKGVINGDTIVNQNTGSIQVPGYEWITVESMYGLVGTNEKIMTRNMNLVIGADRVSDNDRIEFKYDEFARWYELFFLTKIGAMIMRPEEVIIEAV